MKVLHVIPSVAAVRGGPSQAVLQMVQALRTQGVLADLVTTNDNGAEQLSVPCHQWLDSETVLGDRTPSVPIQFFPRVAAPLAPLREFAVSPTLTRWLWQQLPHYDLVHVHAIFSYPSTVAMAIARYHQIPYIVRPLGQLCHWSLQQKSQKKRLYLNLLERQNLQHSRAIHFTSSQEAIEAQALNLDAPGFILPHGLAPVDPVPNAHQRLRQWLQLPDRHPVLLFLSRLHPKKGLEALLQALAHFKATPFTLVIAGEGEPEYEAKLDQCIVDHGLAQRVRRVGFVSGDRKQLLLQGSDLFTLTSYSENFGVAVLEAMAAGLPTLLSPGVALASLVQAEGLGWVVSQDPTELVPALQHFFQQPQQVQWMGMKARQIALERFTWPRIAERLTTQYQQLVPSRSTATHDVAPDYASHSDLQRSL